MSSPPFMPLYVGDYLADTTHLSTVEHGAYFLLICAYWRRGSPLPDDDDQLARITRLDVKAWARIRPVMAAFFTVSETWAHGRIDTVLAESLAKSKGASASANARWKKSERISERNANAYAADMPSQCSSSSSSSSSSEPRVKKIPSESILGGRVALSHEIPEFETLKSLYPKRAGDQRWPHAIKACKARLSEGYTWGDIITGVQRYAAFVTATGKVGTEYVQQAATFLGPGKGFAQAWALPASAQTVQHEARRRSNFDTYQQVIQELSE